MFGQSPIAWWKGKARYEEPSVTSLIPFSKLSRQAVGSINARLRLRKSCIRVPWSCMTRRYTGGTLTQWLFSSSVVNVDLERQQRCFCLREKYNFQHLNSLQGILNAIILNTFCYVPVHVGHPTSAEWFVLHNGMFTIR